MTRLDNPEFLKQVNDVLIKNNGKSSVYITQKRLSPALSLDDKPGINDLSTNVTDFKDHFNNQTYPVLIRISLNGKDKKDKLKLSTVVDHDRLDSFWNEYVQLIKTGFTGLKKKEKKRAKKGKVSK